MADEDDDDAPQGPWSRYAGPAPAGGPIQPDEYDQDNDNGARAAWEQAPAAAQPALRRTSGAASSAVNAPPRSGEEASTSLVGSTSSPSYPDHNAVMADINATLNALQSMPAGSTLRSGGGGGARGRMFLPPSRASGAAPAIPPVRAPLLSPVQAERRQDTRERTGQLGNSLRIFEDLLGDWSAEQKAHAIHQQYGFRVDPQALRRGTVWWRKQRT